MNTTMPISLAEWMATAQELQTENARLSQRVDRLETWLAHERAQVIMATREQWSNATVLEEARAELVEEGML